MGPPRVAPYWLRCSGFFVPPFLLVKKSAASSTELRRYSKAVPMKFIGTALSDNVYLSSRTTTELRCGHAGLYGKLLHRVGDAKIAEVRVDLRIDVADTVQQKNVGLGTSPGHAEAATLGARGTGQDAGRNQGQVQILARVQRHVRYHLAINYVA